MKSNNMDEIIFKNGSKIIPIESASSVRSKGRRVEIQPLDDAYIESSKDTIYAVLLEVGTKLKLRDIELERLKNEPYVQENFKLNVKRLNRWWYSVYFDKKCNHENINEDEFCLDCGERIKL